MLDHYEEAPTERRRGNRKTNVQFAGVPPPSGVPPKVPDDVQEEQDENDDNPFSATRTSRNTDRHTIISNELRTGRFCVVVLLALGVAFTYASLTSQPHTLVKGTGDDDAAQQKLEVYNALFGTLMFTAGKAFEVYNDALIFPTLHTYLHNTPMFPGDQPHRARSTVKENFVFWGLRITIILMNVGTASLFVGLSQVGGSSGATTRHLTDVLPMGVDAHDTVLRTAITGVTMPFHDYADSACGLGMNGERGVFWSDVASPSVRFGFPRRPWNAYALPFGSTPSHRISFTLDEMQLNQQGLERQLLDQSWSIATLRGLVAQGETHATMGGSTSASLPLQDALTVFVNKIMQGQTTDIGRVGVTVERHDLSEELRLESLSLEIPAPARQAAQRPGCGATKCVVSSGINGIKQELVLRPFVSDAASAAHDQHSVFLYGSGGHATKPDPYGNSSDPVEYLSIAMAKLSWSSTQLHDKYGMECDDSTGSCMGLTFPLHEGNSILLLGEEGLPLHNNSPVRLATVSSSPTVASWRVVQSDDTVNALDSCDALVDAFAEFSTANRLAIESPLQSLYTAAVFYLFQNAVEHSYAVESHQLTLSRALATAKDDGRVWKQITLGIPMSSAISTFAGCGAMVLLMFFVIKFPTARVRLTPNTTPAAQYVQILTDDLYPDVVHKKRLRFQNGDALPFNEYVVDTIVLHAKRNPSKKIWLF